MFGPSNIVGRLKPYFKARPKGQPAPAAPAPTVSPPAPGAAATAGTPPTPTVPTAAQAAGAAAPAQGATAAASPPDASNPAASTAPPVDPATDLGMPRRAQQLSRELAELQWDLGGLTYEMAIRDHFRLDLLVRQASRVQAVDAELGALERLLRLEQSGAAGSCGTCGALYARGAVFCWQCGSRLVAQTNVGEPTPTAPPAAATLAVAEQAKPAAPADAAKPPAPEAANETQQTEQIERIERPPAAGPGVSANGPANDRPAPAPAPRSEPMVAERQAFSAYRAPEQRPPARKPGDGPRPRR